MKKHLQEFTVYAYKGIHNLTLESLNTVNILTGDNNSGKTSVLDVDLHTFLTHFYTEY